MKKQPPHYKRRKAAAAVAGPRAQRGSAAVFAAAALLAMIASTLLALNIGRLYYAQRDLQKLATVGALAAVESASGCNGASGMRSTSAATTRVTQIIQANLPSGSTTTAAQLLTAINSVAGVQLGMENTSGVNPTSGANDGYYHFVSLADGDSRIDAAVVNLSETAPTMVGAMFFPGYTPITLHASATAMQQPLGGFYVGSTLANLNTTNSALLNPLLSLLLGTSLNLSALDYQNLAGVQLSLANLEVAAGVNDLNSLLALNTNLGGLEQLLTSATNLVNPSVANLLTGLTLGTSQASSPISLATLLGNLGADLNPTVTDAASLVPSLDLLDLLQEAGEAAAGNSPNGSFLTLSGTPSVPNLLNTYVYLSIGQPQVYGYGPVGATASTAQITLHVRANVDPSLLDGILALVKTLTLGLVGENIAPINLGLDLYVAPASGTLASLTCPTTATPSPSATVSVGTNVAKVKIGTYTGNPSDNAAAGGPTLVAGNLVSVSGTIAGLTIALNSIPAALTVGSNTDTTAGPFSIYTSPQPVNSKTEPNVYYYMACNSLATALNPCAPTNSDPNNPAAPIPSQNLLSGVTTLVTELTANNNLTITLTVLGIPLNLSGILDPLLGLINTLVLAPLTTLLDDLLNPLLQLLGLQVGSSTVLMNTVVTGQQVIVNTNLPGSSNF